MSTTMQQKQTKLITIMGGILKRTITTFIINLQSLNKSGSYTTKVKKNHTEKPIKEKINSRNTL